MRDGGEEIDGSDAAEGADAATDLGDDETVEADSYDWFEDYLAAKQQKKTLKGLPGAVSNALRMVWSTARRPFLVATALAVLSGLGLGAQLLIGKNAIDEVLRANSSGAGLRAISGQLLAFAVVTITLQFLKTVENEQNGLVGRLVGREADTRVLDVAAAADLSAFESPDFYDRLRRARDGAGFRITSIVFGLVGMAQSTVSLLAVALVLLAIEPVLLPLVLLGAVPLSVVQRKVTKQMYEFNLWRTPSERERSYLETVLTGRDQAKEIRSFSLLPPLRRRYDELYDDYLRAYGDIVKKRLRLSLIGNAVSAVFVAGSIAVLLALLLADRIPVGGAAAALAALQQMSARAKSFLGGANSIFESALFLEDYTTFVGMKEGFEAARPTARAPIGFDRLVVDDVSFTYPGSAKPALRNVSIEIGAGDVIALVGENGSGKTTLAKLLCQLYAPTEGRILWDGVDTATVDPDGLRASIAVIFQDFVRYQLPARANVGFGRHERMDDLEAIRAAARAGGADRLLANLPEGYDTVLSKEFKGGRDLSVGQWQRVAMSRAFFRDAGFIVLDEPTAALDPRAEHALFQSLRELCAGRSVLLISHRFSSVTSADRIYVLDHGAVVEHGTHGELMAKGGLYAELFSLQAAAYLTDSDRSDAAAAFDDADKALLND